MHCGSKTSARYHLGLKAETTGNCWTNKYMQLQQKARRRPKYVSRVTLQENWSFRVYLMDLEQCRQSSIQEWQVSRGLAVRLCTPPLGKSRLPPSHRVPCSKKKDTWSENDGKPQQGPSSLIPGLGLARHGLQQMESAVQNRSMFGQDHDVAELPY